VLLAPSSLEHITLQITWDIDFVNIGSQVGDVEENLSY